MPICKKCESPFPNRIVVDGKPRNLCKRKYCLTCSPFGAHNTKRLETAGEQVGEQKEFNISLCRCCGRKVKWKREPLSLCHACKSKTLRIRQRLRAIQFFGGVCQECEWSGHPSGFAFHHINPADKEFEIGKSFGNMSWKRLMGELGKCALLCFACHIQKHGDRFDIKFVRAAIDGSRDHPDDIYLGWLGKDVQKDLLGQLSHKNGWKEEERYCTNCGGEFRMTHRDQKFCSPKCFHWSQRRTDRPSKEELKRLTETMPMTRIGEMFGVSDNSIRKWLTASE